MATLIIFFLTWKVGFAQTEWEIADCPVYTEWSKKVAPGNIFTEYPRPQLEREEWLNLNGLWDYAIIPADMDKPAKWDGKILVPFCAESALSGVGREVGPENRLWYHRTFEIPGTWEGRNILNVQRDVETVAKLLSGALSEGAKVFNVISVDDTLIIDDRVCGFVINWSPVNTTNLHVDPLTIRAKYVIEATGHPLEVLNRFCQKKGKLLNTRDGDVQWEEPMDSSQGEKLCLENTKEVYPGVFVTGMAANAVYGSPRMGPVFGGMLMSGKKVAEQIIERLQQEGQ